MNVDRVTCWRHRVYELLEDDESASPHRRKVDAFLIAFILVAVLVAALETVPSMRARWHSIFALFEIIAGFVFVLEYALRIWVAIDDRAGHFSHPLWGRLRYALSPSALIDLIAISPLLVSVLMPESLIFLRMLRLVRIVKLARYSPAIALLQVVIYNQRSALAAGAMVVLSLLMLVSSFVYMAESRAQPETFGTIPDAMWWAVVTMTTVGYGDVIPVTLAGKLIAAATSFLGLALIAVPTAILAEGFAQELQKRDDTKMAETVAALPQFEGLSGRQLSRLVPLLHTRTLPPRYHVVRRGEYPDMIYFIKSGNVAAQTPEGHLQLGPQDCFGGRALLAGTQTMTVTTLTRVTLIQLPKSCLIELDGSDPALAEKIRERVTAEPS